MSSLRRVRMPNLAIFCNWITCFSLSLFCLIQAPTRCSGGVLLHRAEALNNEAMCDDQGYSHQQCVNLAREKYGYKQDEREMCCFLADIQHCILRRREEFCRGSRLEVFKKEYNFHMNELKNSNCKKYFDNLDCEEEMEAWTFVAAVMLCLISSMACITLCILYAKK